MLRKPINLNPLSKFGNTKVIYDNIEFDSKKEMTRYIQLKYLQRAGEISGLQLQHSFILQEGFKDRSGKYYRPIVYIADFIYHDKNFPNWIVEDTKGMKTDVYQIKKKLLLKRYPNITFKET